MKLLTKEAAIKNLKPKNKLVRQAGFSRFRNLPLLAKSKHFALHAVCLPHSDFELGGVQFDLAFILPKKFAKSSVRRNGIRRQAKALLDIHKKDVSQKESALPDKRCFGAQADSLNHFTMLIRLRKPVDKVVYESPWSSKLKNDIRAEMANLFTYLCKPC